MFSNSLVSEFDIFGNLAIFSPLRPYIRAIHRVRIECILAAASASEWMLYCLRGHPECCCLSPSKC